MVWDALSVYKNNDVGLEHRIYTKKKRGQNKPHRSPVLKLSNRQLPSPT